MEETKFCPNCHQPLPKDVSECPNCTVRLNTEKLPIIKYPSIPGYKILRPIGEGGMGKVYLAEDENLGRPVAIKMISHQLEESEEASTRFLREAKSMAAIEHPHIVRIYTYGKSGDKAYFVMEYIEGESLDHHIKRKGKLSVNEALRILKQVVLALADAWERKIIHRDIKPSNILMDQKGQVKLADFGLAKSTKINDERTLTSPIVFRGSPDYVSPERVEGNPVDFRSDIYSLGIVLYEMLVGERPFEGKTFMEIIGKQLGEPIPSIKKKRPDIPEQIHQFIEWMTQKDPKKRPPSYTEIMQFLDSFLEIQRKVKIPGRPKRWKGYKPYLYISLILFLLLVIVWSGLFFDIFKKERKVMDSIAILPFVNLSDDPAREYFSDGMTEALIADLARIDSLKVISRTSVMRYKKTVKSLPEIARELNVESIVEGSVLRTHNQVRITVQLVDAETDQYLWARSYERDLEDILKLQREVAHLIANEIKLKLTPQQELFLSTPEPIDREAYEAYLKGRYLWNKRTRKDLEKSILYFEEAINKYPSYAAAYSGLADAYLNLGDWGYCPQKEMYPRAIQMAKKALEYDNNLAEAYTTLAYIAFIYQWQWTEAERLFNRALDLNPQYAITHQWYAEYLIGMGRKQEALASINRALDLDPLSPIISIMKGDILYRSRRYDEAIIHCRNLIKFEGHLSSAYYNLYCGYLKKGMDKEAIEAFINMISTSPRNKEYITEINRIYKQSGTEGFHRWLINEGLQKIVSEPHYPYYLYTCTHALLGEKDQAFQWLEKAYDNHSYMIAFIKMAPELDNIRDDPRFKELLKKMGLEK